MAAAEQDLVFESFLKKRKDTMIFRWSNYWFRLRNTTLSFYTSNNANESCLRGKYYIYLVQSVREVKAIGASHTFEIVMKNGKRKLLSAESADLCKIWIQLLWKSMQLPAPGRSNSSCTWHDMPSLVESTNVAVQSRPESRNEPDDSKSEAEMASPLDSFHSENESYSEEEDAAFHSHSPELTTSHENQSNSEEVDSAVGNVLPSGSEEDVSKPDCDERNENNSDNEESVYDVPTWRRYGEHRAADTEKREEKNKDSENESFDVYDVPKSKSVSSSPADTASQGAETMTDGFSSQNFWSTKSTVAGVTTDEAEQKATDSYFASQDEDHGRSTV